MEKIILNSKAGYGIPCVCELCGNKSKVVIISHGFGSSKESPTAISMAERLKKEGIDSVRFDFPAHGDSDASGDDFRINNCLNDLNTVEENVRKLLPNAEILYFSSSFGAFINLIYMSRSGLAGRKSFLRCAAIDMPGIMKSWLDEGLKEKLSQNGYLIFDEDYVRPLKVTNGFWKDLEGIDLYNDFENDKVEIRMIHGDADETAPFDDALRFAQKYNIRLIKVPGSDHRFTPQGAMDKVRDEAVKFFME